MRSDDSALRNGTEPPVKLRMRTNLIMAMKKPLEFPGELTQLQWCTATLQHLQMEVFNNRAPLNGDHPLIVNLLRGLQSQCQITVQAICLVIVKAISLGVFSGDVIITNLISSCALMHHWAKGVSTLSEILTRKVLTSLKSSGSFTCPYSLRTSPHPFITIINSKPESGMLVSNLTIQMLRESVSTECLESMLQLLTPFVKYILLHPSPSSDHKLIASHLQTSLHILAENLHAEHCKESTTLLLHTLTSFLPLTPTTNNQCILILTNQIERLTTLWSKLGAKKMLLKMVDACLAGCCKMIEMCLSIHPLLNCVLDLVRSQKVQLVDHQMLCLSWLMLHSLLVPSTVNLILRIVVASIELSLKPLPSVAVMTLPVVQVLSLPSSSQISNQAYIQKTANHIMQDVKKSVSCEWSSGASKCHTFLLNFQPYPLFKSESNILPVIWASPVEMHTWLNHLTHELNLSKMSTSFLEILCLMLSAVFARALDDGSVPPALITSFCNLAKAKPILSPSLIPLFLYFLPRMSSPSDKLALLHSLPSLATHHFAVGPTANILQALAGNTSLLPLSLRLLGNLWIEHNSIFPHVKDILSYSKVPASIKSEFDIAKAIVIRDICNKRGEQHGEEMLSQVSLIIEKSYHPLAIALVIEALAKICQCGVIDPVTVWAVFGERLSNDQRTAVEVATCSVLSLAANVDSEQRSVAKKFKTDALKHLWTLVFCQNHQVCSAALNALSTFPMDDFLLEHLPPEAPVVPSAPILADAGEPTEMPLPPAYCALLVTAVPEQSLEALCRFLCAMLSPEIEAIPRGIISSALKLSQTPSVLEKSIRGLENTLEGVCLANQDKDSAYGLVAGTALMLNGMSARILSADGYFIGKQQAMREMKKYISLLEVLLGSGRVCFEVSDSGEGIEGALTCLVLPRHWAAFMSKVWNSFTKVWLAQNCPSSVWHDTSVLKEKTLIARDWAKQEILKKLTELSTNNPQLSSSIVLCLVGIVCSKQKDEAADTEASSNSWSPLELLQSMIIEVVNAIGDDQCIQHSDDPITTLFSNLRQHVSKSVYLLTCPVLVEAVLHCSIIPPLTLHRVLEQLIYCLWAQVKKCRSWYGGVIFNEVLMMLLPTLSQVHSFTKELVHFVKASVQSQSFDNISFASSFLPSLTLTNQNDMCIGIMNSVKKMLQIGSTDELANHHTQIASLHHVNLCGTLYSCGLIADEVAMESVTLLADLATKAPHIPAYHFSFGVILHLLVAASHPKILSLTNAIAVRWIQQLEAARYNQEVIAVSWGLAGLIGINPVLEKMWYCNYAVPLNFVESLFPILKDTYSKMCGEDDPSIATTATWLLGHMYQNLSVVLTNAAKIPKDYSYLSENALLPALLSLVSSENLSVSRARCILELFSSLTIQFPPCCLSAVILPFTRPRELQICCVRLMVNQSSVMGLKPLAVHILNIMLRGCLQKDAELLLLEHIHSVVNLLPTLKYLQLLSLFVFQHYLNSQDHLLCLIKGLKGVISVTTDQTSSVVSRSDIGNLIREIWEMICDSGRITELVGEGELVLTILAECLAVMDYHMASLEEYDSVSLIRLSFDALLKCCWVESGRNRVSSLTSVIQWTLQNATIVGEETFLCAVMKQLFRVIHNLCDSKRQKTVQAQTELLHSLLVWSRGANISALQMHWMLFLCLLLCSPSPPPSYTKIIHTDLEQWLAHFSLPNDPFLQEKVLRCVLEWFSIHDEDIHKTCLLLLERFTETSCYGDHCVWTAAAHLL